MAQFVTSTRLLNASLADVFPILSLDGPRTSNKDYKFIERFFPRTEQEFKNLIVFRKRQKRSAKMRMKKASS